jgi:probable addiction module antidote protein
MLRSLYEDIKTFNFSFVRFLISILAHALEGAAKAWGMLAVSLDTGVDRAGLYHSFTKGDVPRISTFDKVASSLRYHLILALV